MDATVNWQNHLRMTKLSKKNTHDKLLKNRRFQS